MTDKRAKELAEDVIRNELKASEAMGELATEYDNEQINEAMEDVLDILIKNIDDPQRKLAVFELIYTIGQRIGSDTMARRGKELYEDFVDKHGRE